MPAITTLLLDADGVIQRNPQFRYQMQALLGEGVDLWALHAIERLALTGERDLRVELEAFLAENRVNATFDDVLRIWLGTTPDADALRLVDEIRRGGTSVHVATNQTVYRGTYMQQDLGYAQRFDRCFYSYELGVAKPDPAFFTVILERLGADPDTTLFVDDIEANVEGARQAGIRAEFHDREQGTPALIALLARYGLPYSSV